MSWWYTLLCNGICSVCGGCVLCGDGSKRLGSNPPRSSPHFYSQFISFLNVPVPLLSWLHFVPQRSTLQRNPIYNREKWKLGSSEGIVLVKFPTGLLTHRLCTGRKTQYNSHSTHFIRWDKTKGLTLLIERKIEKER